MSLQSDFEFCLEYAEKLEAEHEQRIQAQNNIMCMQNESERLKSKIKVCTTLTVLSAIVSSVLAWIMISIGGKEALEGLPALVLFAIVFVVSLFVRMKTKKASDALESKKPLLIQEYTMEVENCTREITRLVDEIYEEDLFDIVPREYFCTAAIKFCLSQVHKKLANTATEAFRQLEAEIKRLEQMEYLEQMHSAQMDQLDDIKRAIQVNTMITLAEQNRRNS